MKRILLSLVTFAFAASLFLISVSTHAATVVQGAAATAVSFEADTVASIIAGTPESWVSTNDAAASGGTALYASGTNATATSPHSFAQYSIRFATSGTYYVYYRWRSDPARTVGDAFTANSSQFPKQFGAFSTPGDLTPFNVSSSNGGQAPTNNVYNWQREADTRELIVDATNVTSNVPLIFTLGTREAGMTIDRFILSLDPALTAAQLDAIPNSGATTAAPQLTRAVGSALLTEITVFFTRPLDAGTVTPGDFTVNRGLVVNSVQVDPADPRIVMLTTTAQTAGTNYTVTVTGVSDASGTPIAPGSTISFTAWKIVSGWALKEVYFAIAGTTVAEFVADPKYPASPDRVEWVKGFQLDDPQQDNYGARLSAFFAPQTNGVYTFFVNNDDEAELQLSTDTSAANLQSLGVFPLSPRVFSDTASASSPSLTASQRYLLYGLLKQVSGPVYLNVAAKLQSDTTPGANLNVLSGNQIATWINPDLGNVTFTQQPTNVSAAAGSRATFRVKVNASESPVYYQWRVNGINIEGAVRATYITPVLSTGDSGKVYSVVVSVAGKDTVSNNATLTVTPGSTSNQEPFLGLNFVGGGTAGGAALSRLDVAGVVPQENWNNLEGFAFDPSVTPQTLVDAKGSNTLISLTSSTAAEVWYTGTKTVGSADGALLQGFVNAVSAVTPVTFTLNNVPQGTYKVLVYSLGFDFTPNYFQAFSVTGASSYPTIHGHVETGLTYINSPAYRRMSSVNPASPDVGNYVLIDNVSPATDGTLSIDVTWEPADPAVSNGHSPAINAIQLVRITAVGPVLSIQRGPGSSLTVSWTGGGRLQESSTLTAGSWTFVAGNPSGSYQVNPGTTGFKFYRVIVP